MALRKELHPEEAAKRPSRRAKDARPMSRRRHRWRLSRRPRAVMMALVSDIRTSASPADRSDMPRGHWIDRRVPAAARPYLRLMRLDRPIGTWLLLLPGWWAIALAAPPGRLPDLRLLALFAIGAVAMRGAGCVVNDMADRDFDARVARTAARPIPSGAVSLRQAGLFLAALLVAGLAVLLSL